MSVLIVASDRDGAGKTAAVLGLAESARRRGADVAALKPFASRPGDSDPLDISRVAASDVAGLPGPVPVGERPPSADDWRPVADALGSATGDALIELPASVGVQGAKTAADALGARVLLVAGYRRGLAGGDFAGWRDALGDSLAGVLINGVTRYLGSEARENLAPSLAVSGVPRLGMIPEDRFMLSVTVDDLRAALGGRYVVEEGDIRKPIERFQVGVMSLDPGELRFGLYENNAVVVRGDRPDIQMSALGSSIACLTLTGGIDPIEYIMYEAREEETPVMVVESDTLATMDALNEATANPPAATPPKAARFADLLEAHADIDALLSA